MKLLETMMVQVSRAFANRKKQFTLELTTTALCNLGCTYCFEGVKTDKRRLDDKVEIVKQRIHEMLDSNWFQEEFGLLNISFWGGEPTLNNQFVIDIMQEFQNNPDIDFHIYTNAYNRKRLDDILDSVDTSKLRIQVSWDGVDLSNKFRITHSGRGSSQQVLENLEHLVKRGVNVSLKSTIPLQAMDSVYKTWKDFKKLHDYYKDYPNVRVSYAPTIDYVSDLPDQIIPESVALFRSEMLKVAKEEIKFYKEHQRFLCSWFAGGEDKIHCASGANMHAINIDGKGYACHGSLYSPYKEDMGGTDIHDDSFIEDLKKMTTLYKAPLGRVSEICKGCVATTCMICPVSSYDLSKKDDFFDRWQDRWVNNMCGFFKAFGEIDRTVQAYLDNHIGSHYKTEEMV